MKVIAAMNMTLDGFCDHTLGVVSEELHYHYKELLENAGVALYGRTTYQLMEYWPTVLKNPTGNKSDYDFAVAIDKVPKVVFSHTLKNLDWHSARLATRSLKDEVSALKQQTTKDIYACSPSLIVQLIQLKMIDEFQLCVHPLIAGSGLTLFKNISEQVTLKYVRTKPFQTGALVHYYEVVRD